MHGRVYTGTILLYLLFYHRLASTPREVKLWRLQFVLFIKLWSMPNGVLTKGVRRFVDIKLRKTVYIKHRRPDNQTTILCTYWVIFKRRFLLVWNYHYLWCCNDIFCPFHLLFNLLWCSTCSVVRLVQLFGLLCCSSCSVVQLALLFGLLYCSTCSVQLALFGLLCCSACSVVWLALLFDLLC